ncbi:hypothetical protein HKX48_001586, partial [Thoreauomyces humboldtii]
QFVSPPSSLSNQHLSALDLLAKSIDATIAGVPFADHAHPIERGNDTGTGTEEREREEKRAQGEAVGRNESGGNLELEGPVDRRGDEEDGVAAKSEESNDVLENQGIPELVGGAEHDTADERAPASISHEPEPEVKPRQASPEILLGGSDKEIVQTSERTKDGKEEVEGSAVTATVQPLEIATITVLRTEEPSSNVATKDDACQTELTAAKSEENVFNSDATSPSELDLGANTLLNRTAAGEALSGTLLVQKKSSRLAQIQSAKVVKAIRVAAPKIVNPGFRRLSTAGDGGVGAVARRPSEGRDRSVAPSGVTTAAVVDEAAAQGTGPHAGVRRSSTTPDLQNATGGETPTPPARSRRPSITLTYEESRARQMALALESAAVSKPPVVPTPPMARSITMSSFDKSLPPTPDATSPPTNQSQENVSVKRRRRFSNPHMSSSDERPQSLAPTASSATAAATPSLAALASLKLTQFRIPFSNSSSAESSATGSPDGSESFLRGSEPLNFTIHSPSNALEVKRRTTHVVDPQSVPASRRGSILTSSAMGSPGSRARSGSQSSRSSIGGGGGGGIGGGRRASGVRVVGPIVVDPSAVPPSIPSLRFSGVPLRDKLNLNIPATPPSSLPSSTRDGAGMIDATPEGSYHASMIEERDETSNSTSLPRAEASAVRRRDDNVPTIEVTHLDAAERLLMNARTAMGSDSVPGDPEAGLGPTTSLGKRSVSVATMGSVRALSSEDVSGLQVPVRVNGSECIITHRHDKLVCIDARGKLYGRHFSTDLSRILVAGNIGPIVTFFSIPAKTLSQPVKFRSFVFECMNETVAETWCERLNFAACDGNFSSLVDHRAVLLVDGQDAQALLDLVRRYITPVLGCVGKELTLQVMTTAPSETTPPDLSNTNFLGYLSLRDPVPEVEKWMMKAALCSTERMEDVEVLTGGEWDPMELALAMVKAPLAKSQMIVGSLHIQRAGLTSYVKKILKR